MTFLPIVERELRVAARRPGIYRTRWFAAAGTMAVWLLLLGANRRAPAAELSHNLFVTLGILALAFCLVAGIFLTADCLSEEKREGTLGLLFLTDLRGYDVVLGKLIATSVHSAYGLLAIFPVLALPLMMGGVTGGEFWRAVAVLAVTLLLSLTMGMFVSSLVRESRHSMAGAFLGMLVLAGAVPAAWYLADFLVAATPSTAFLWPSPVNAFANALDSNYRRASGMRDYWCSVQTLAGISLSLLAVAAVFLPRAWQEKVDRRSADRSARRSQDSAPVTGRFQRLHWMLDVNPYLWLANRVSQRDVLGPILLGLLILAWLCSLASAVTLDGRQSASGAFVVSFFSAFAIHLVAKYLVTVEATRQLGEDRRSGALELLLVTPLPEAQILSGQQQALRRRSWVLLWTLLFVNVCMCLVVLTAPKALHFSRTDRVLFSELFIGGMIVALLDFRALQTVGMCVALRAGRHQRAVLGTLGRVMLVPWAGCFLWFFLSVTNAIRPSQDGLAATFALWFVIGIVCDLYLIAQARVRLGRGLRYWVAEGHEARKAEWFPTPQPSTLAVQSG